MYAVIDFTDEAKEMCTFDINNLRIFLYDENNNLIEVRDYNRHEIRKITEMKIPIIERMDTSSCRVPLDPKRMLLLSRLRVK